jgi:thioesterase domain-containing protein
VLDRGYAEHFDSRKIIRLHLPSQRPQIFGINNTGAYYLLAKHLGAAWPLTSLQLFDPSRPVESMPQSVEEIAAQYVQLIRQVQPKGPYNLLSWCVGGLLNMEVAHQLLAAGEQISFLGIIEGYAPFQFERFNWLREKIARNAYRIHWNLAELGKLRKGEVSLRSFFTARQSLLTKPEPAPTTYGPWLMACYLTSVAKTYRLKTFPGRIHLFRASESPRGAFLDEANGWGRYAAGGVQVSFVKGDHDSIFRPPGVNQLANGISAALTQIGHADMPEREMTT